MTVERGGPFRYEEAGKNREVRIPKQEEEGVRFMGGELSPEEMERTRRDLAEFIGDSRRYIDRGGAGSVHRLSGGVCFKAIEPRRFSPGAHLMDIGNPVAVEAQYLAGISRLNVRGVRTCKCYGFFESSRPEDPDILLMEELDAVNLQHVLNDTASAPDSFNPETFLDDYWDFLDELHRQGIAHGDVAPRNVMIDRKTGKPRVIDFGRSQRIPREGSKRDRFVDKDAADFELVYDAVAKKFNLA